MLPDPNGRQIDICECANNRHHFRSFGATNSFLDSWNDAAVAAAWDESIPHKDKALAVYAASKTEAERQSWKWMETNKPHFNLNTVVPCFNVSSLHR